MGYLFFPYNDVEAYLSTLRYEKIVESGFSIVSVGHNSEAEISGKKEEPGSFTLFLRYLSYFSYRRERHRNVQMSIQNHLWLKAY